MDERPPTADQTDSAAPAASTGDADALKQGVIEMLSTVTDPEIPVNIYELGLIYEVRVDETGAVDIKMTLTSPACPVAGSLPGEVEMRARSVDGASEVKVELVWDPPWDKDMMSEAAQLKLGFM